MENQIQIYVGIFPDHNTKSMYVGSHILEPNNDIDEFEEMEDPKYWSKMSQEVGQWIDPDGYYFSDMSSNPISISDLCKTCMANDDKLAAISSLFNDFEKKNGTVLGNTIMVFYACNEDLICENKKLSYGVRYIGAIDE
jgi:hypothetical protein